MDNLFNSIIDQLAASIGQDRSLIISLSNLGVIAGGSIAHCLTSQGGIKDIDVFLLNCQDHETRKGYMSSIRTLLPDAAYYGKAGLGVLDVKIGEKLPTIQFIFCKQSSLEEVCENFDLDYVVCGIYKSRVYYPPATVEVHETKFISVYPEMNESLQRLVKAVRKGYNSYYFGYSEPIERQRDPIRDPEFVPSLLFQGQYGQPDLKRLYKDFELVGISYHTLPIYKSKNGWGTIKKSPQYIINGKFVIKHNRGFLLANEVCMRFTIWGVNRKKGAVREVVGINLASDARVFHKVQFFEWSPNDRSGVKVKIGVEKNYAVSCYKTYCGRVCGLITRVLEDGWVPFPVPHDLCTPSLDQRIEMDSIVCEQLDRVPFMKDLTTHKGMDLVESDRLFFERLHCELDLANCNPNPHLYTSIDFCIELMIKSGDDGFFKVLKFVVDHLLEKEPENRRVLMQKIRLLDYKS